MQEALRPQRYWIRQAITLVIVSASTLTLAAFPAFSRPSSDTRASSQQQEPLISEPEIPVEALADQLQYVKAEKKVVGIGNVVVMYKDTKLTADRAEIFTDTKKAYAEGHVVVQQGRNTLKGEKVYYDFEHRQGSFPKGRYVDYPFYGRGAEIEQASKDLIRVQNGTITTCDLDDPHYVIQSQRVKIYPGDKLIAYNVVFKVLGKPLAWVPFITVPLEQREAPFKVVPGYSSEFGAYVEMSKGFSINKNIHGKAQLDLRQRRGIGYGFDGEYNYTDKHKYLGYGIVRTYFINDKRSPDWKAEDPYHERSRHSRWRFQLRHRSDFDPYSNLIISHNQLSDEYLLQDFFQCEYDRETQPKSLYIFTKNTKNTGFMVQVEKRYNHFFDELERLPELRFTINKQRMWNTNFYYGSETDYANLNQKEASGDNNYHATRFDTYHEVNFPIKWQQIVFNPSFNFRETEYSRDRYTPTPISRQALGGIVDVSTRFYRLYDIETNMFGLDIHKVRHIIEPYFKYTTNLLTTTSAWKLQKFDYIDDVDNENKFFFGAENRIQTKRFVDGVWHRVDVVSLNTYALYSMNDNIAGASHFRTIGAKLEMRPYNWLTLQNVTNYDAAAGTFMDTDFEAEVMYRDKLSFYLSYQFQNDKDMDAITPPEKSSLLTADFSYKLNSLWTAGGYARFEMESCTMQEWELRLTRDLHCWLLDFGYNSRHSDRHGGDKKTDQALFFTLTLKAFPEVTLESGNRSSYSKPRIGTYVAGANEKQAFTNVITAKSLSGGELEARY